MPREARSTPGVAIRDATAEDAEALARLVEALNLGLGWPECRFTPEDFRRDGLGSGRWFDTLVAERGTDLVGYAMLHRSYDTETARRGAYLMDLYVAEDARRLGVGRALLAAAAARARAWGGDVLWWVTTEGNEVGKAFYRSVAERVTGIEVWIAEAERFDALLGPRRG